MNETDKRIRILTAAALKVWGKRPQIIMLFEEMAELTQCLTKDLRRFTPRDQIAEEIADVKLMLAQMEYIYDVVSLVQKHLEAKTKRTMERVLAADEFHIWLTKQERAGLVRWI